MPASEAPIPLYGFVEGDTLGVVVLARSEDTVRALAARLLEAAALRVAPAGEIGRASCRERVFRVV